VAGVSGAIAHVPPCALKCSELSASGNKPNYIADSDLHSDTGMVDLKDAEEEEEAQSDCYLLCDPKQSGSEDDDFVPENSESDLRKGQRRMSVGSFLSCFRLTCRF
jgi:hypothetical protein